jgi:thiol-disulfide isomerase/thioredoxin
MKKALPFFIVAVICVVLAIRYFRPDLISFAGGTEDGATNAADIDQPLPHAVMPSVDGDWVDLEKYKGKVVLINFWTTWCPGCRDEMPDLIKLQSEFDEKGFTVVAIAVDDQGEQSVSNFVKTEHFDVNGSSLSLNFPVLMGHDELSRKIGFEGGLPASILVTRDGKEMKIIRGPLHQQQASKIIKNML